MTHMTHNVQAHCDSCGHVDYDMYVDTYHSGTLVAGNPAGDCEQCDYGTMIVEEVL